MLFVFVARAQQKFPCCNWIKGKEARSEKMQRAGANVDDKCLYLFLLKNPDFEAHDSVAMKRVSRHIHAYVNAWYDADPCRGISPYCVRKHRKPRDGKGKE